jgi:transcription initiation factor TFIID subunit 2
VSTTAPERGELLPSEVRVEFTSEDEELLKQTLTEVDRYRSMDRLIPSVHNIVTIAALEVGVSQIQLKHLYSHETSFIWSSV